MAKLQRVGCRVSSHLVGLGFLVPQFVEQVCFRCPSVGTGLSSPGPKTGMPLLPAVGVRVTLANVDISFNRLGSSRLATAGCS